MQSGIGDHASAGEVRRRTEGRGRRLLGVPRKVRAARGVRVPRQRGLRPRRLPRRVGGRVDERYIAMSDVQDRLSRPRRSRTRSEVLAQAPAHAGRSGRGARPELRAGERKRTGNGGNSQETARRGRAALGRQTRSQHAAQRLRTGALARAPRKERRSGRVPPRVHAARPSPLARDSAGSAGGAVDAHVDGRPTVRDGTDGSERTRRRRGHAGTDVQGFPRSQRRRSFRHAGTQSTMRHRQVVPPQERRGHAPHRRDARGVVPRIRPEAPLDPRAQGQAGYDGAPDEPPQVPRGHSPSPPRRRRRCRLLLLRRQRSPRRQ
mmetsp:Transcript_122/g.333  ORF Transcript_122/g.333 Transcript_122/m.333 type:complete len:320 (-) Transcript_122:1224-2183(-)